MFCWTDNGKTSYHWWALSCLDAPQTIHQSTILVCCFRWHSGQVVCPLCLWCISLDVPTCTNRHCQFISLSWRGIKLWCRCPAYTAWWQIIFFQQVMKLQSLFVIKFLTLFFNLQKNSWYSTWLSTTTPWIWFIKGIEYFINIVQHSDIHLTNCGIVQYHTYIIVDLSAVHLNCNRYTSKDNLVFLMYHSN